MRVQVHAHWMASGRLAMILGPLRYVCGATLMLAVACLIGAKSPDALAAGSVSWRAQVVSEPTHFAASDSGECASEKKCDRYQLLLQNTGSTGSSGPIELVDRLPQGLTVTEWISGYFSRANETEWVCNVTEEGTLVTCASPEAESVKAGHYSAYLEIVVSSPALGQGGVVRNEVEVTGGGASAATKSAESTEIGTPPSFEVSDFSFVPEMPEGLVAGGAGGHPWEATTSTGTPAGDAPPHPHGSTEGLFAPVRNTKAIAVELPAGLVANPLATERCGEGELREHACPPGSRIGAFSLLDGKGSTSQYVFTEDQSAQGCCSAIYNMVPEMGYPAEFGFTFAENVPILLYPIVVHTGSGYRVRVAVPGVPTSQETIASSVTIFGEPGKLNGTESEEAFLSNPSDCSAEEEGLSGNADGTARDFASRVELTSWGEPTHVVFRESPVYLSLNGCTDLVFRPSLGFETSPAGTGADEEGSTETDAPSAVTVDLGVPQTETYNEASTPDVRDVSATLPEGFSAGPSSAAGLVGCRETGPEGINIGSNNIGPGGEDLGDPEATEQGRGHEGGNNSPYDDGFWHTAPGHCPEASVLGSIEVTTPLLEKPLHGHIYLAEPKCGGEGQPACKESANPAEDSAENGELFGGYLEVAGSGVIVKLPGKISANPVTGQLTGSFDESPQFPFSDVKLHFKGGSRAPLDNPQTCGSFSASWRMSSWAGQDVSGSTAPTEITGCGPSMAFGPSLSAGLGAPVGGGYGSFALSFARNDGEQDFAGLSETMPAGLVGKIAGIPLCGEAQANAGTCSAESEIGSASVLAGSGPEPYRVTGGRVYLTGPYGGGPFGLSIVVPAKAGPFNLGDEVVRAAIHVNPSTAQVTVTTNRFPQLKDGVPLRIRQVDTEITRAGFLRSPTNCQPASVTATLTAAQGASANVSAPLQITGCSGLPFAPMFTESSLGNPSKRDGASLTVTASQKEGEADIQKVDVQLPASLPSRLTTLQKACTEAQFNANPAGCPEGSDVGTAEAQTPLLNVPLRGPAYLVSHGGAAFPDLEFVLQGEGVTIVLDGKTDIKSGITYSKFETVPDAPVSLFKAVFPEGPHSVLAAYGSLCHPTRTVTTSKRVTKRVHGHTRHLTVKVKKTVPQPLVSPTTLVGQNGTVVKQETKITVNNCPLAAKTPAKKTGKKTTKHKKKK